MSSERVASLAMYVAPEPIRAATRQLWAFVRNMLRENGLQGIPQHLDETIAYDAAWLHPDLLLAQTCGYPFASRLRGKVRLVATPCYDYPECSGAFGGSFLIVRGNDSAQSIADFAGRRAAINDPVSNSGYNLFRASVAPVAKGRPFFAEVIETGGHAASLAAIASGAADIAAIDCVTWGNLNRHAPEQLAGLRILAETIKTPGLPLIARGDADDREIAVLRTALERAITDPALAETRRTLGLVGFEHLGEEDYDVILQIERDAVALGYPEIA